MLGIGKDVAGGIENIRLEELSGMGKYGFRIPGDYPGIKQRIAGSAHDAVMDMEYEGPGKDNGDQKEKEQNRGVLSFFRI